MSFTPTTTLESLDDDALLERVRTLADDSRRVEADLIAHLAEVDARGLLARHAARSLFGYCREVLNLSESEAYLRIAVARASRQHPMLLDMLADGRLHLTGAGKLAPHLTLENRDGLLARATRQSKRRIEELIAELSPQPDVPARIRKLPDRRLRPDAVGGQADNAQGRGRSLLGTTSLLDTSPPADASIPAYGSAGTAGDPAPPHEQHVTCVAAGPSQSLSAASFVPLRPHPQHAASVAATVSLMPPPMPGVSALSQVPSPSPVVPASARPTRTASATPLVVPPTPIARVPAQVRPSPTAPARISPLAPSRFKVQFTASAELRDKLVRLQALMRPGVAGGDLAAVIEAAVTEKLERLEARRYARTKAPRKTLAETDTSPRSRRIPAAVRRAVDERDGGRCTFVDAQGRRCTERHRLEYHHAGKAWGRGGDHSVGNLRLACPTHHRLLADLEYGRDWMDRCRRSRRRIGGLPASASAARAGGTKALSASHPYPGPAPGP